MEEELRNLTARLQTYEVQQNEALNLLKTKQEKTDAKQANLQEKLNPIMNANRTRGKTDLSGQ